MPRAGVVLAACLTLALLAGCGDDEPKAIAGGGYTFEAPAGWEEGDGDELGEAFGVTPDVLIFGEDTENGWRENFNVLIQTDLPAGLAIREWVDQNAATIENPPLDSQLAPDAEPPSLTSSPRRIELGDEDAYEFGYTTTASGNEVNFGVVLALHDGDGYIGTVTTGQSAEE